MGITFDGDRSRKLLWFAKRLISTIKTLDLPSKMITYDGFLLRVWRSGDLFNGRITAPMGAVVLYSTVNGISIMTADNWLGGFTGKQYLYSLFKDISSGTVRSLVNRVSEEDMIAAGFQTIPYKPVVVFSPYYPTSPGVFPPAPTFEFDSAPTPGLIPMMSGEAYWLSVTGNIYVDIDGDGNHDPPFRELHESNMNFYLSNGDTLGNRMTVSFETASNIGTARAITYIPSEQLLMVHHQTRTYELITGVGRVAAITYFGKYDSIGIEYFRLSVLIKNMPSGLQTAINHVDSTVTPAGNFVSNDGINSSPILFTVVNLTNTQPSASPSAEDDWFALNPSEEKWRLSYHFFDFDSNSVYSVESSQFIALLDSLSTDPTITPSTNWYHALLMLQQFLPRPNHNFSVPYDSVMFRAEDTNVYVWTREYGAVKFTRTGMFATTIAIPSVVLGTNGIRPTITYAGSGLYLCVCESLDTPLRVHKIYVGSPFGIWTEIPSAEGTDNLVHIRPVRVKLDDIILFGVIEDVEGLYYFSFLRYKDGSGSWERMGQLPITRPDIEPDESNWSVGIFGEGEFSREMSQYLSPQDVLPQMPVGPYDGYTNGMP